MNWTKIHFSRIQLYISFAAFIQAAAGFTLLKVQIDWQYSLACAITTCIIYTLFRSTYLVYRLRMGILEILICLGVVFLWVCLAPQYLLPISVLGILVSLYALPIPKIGISLRQILGLKIIIISFIWLSIGYLLPALVLDQTIDFFLVAAKFMYFLGLCFACDAVDLIQDQRNEQHNVASYLSWSGNKIALIAIWVLAIVIYSLSYFLNNLNGYELMARFSGPLMSIVYIIARNQIPTRRTIQIALDGSIIVQGFMVILSSNIEIVSNYFK